MKEKIKVLFVHSKKLKKKTSSRTLATLIEMESPDTYEFSDVYCGEDIVGQVDKQRPEIVFISPNKSFDAIELVKRIKQRHPSVAVFVVLMSMVEDEQEMIDAFTVAGAYKCYFSTLVLDTLIHDMHVCLNLE